MEEDKQLRAVPSDDDGELIQYDFCKHLTSLSILVLGGLLIVAKDFNPKDVKPTSILIALAVVAIAGVCSFASSSEIVRARSSGTKPGKSQRRLMQTGAALLAIGTGYFIALFADSLA
jgi:hypothetical protein